MSTITPETIAALVKENTETMRKFHLHDNVLIFDNCAPWYGSSMRFGTVERFALNSMGEIIVGVRVPNKLPTTIPENASDDLFGELHFLHPTHLTKIV